MFCNIYYILLKQLFNYGNYSKSINFNILFKMSGWYTNIIMYTCKIYVIYP